MPFFESGKATRNAMPGEDGADDERNELEDKHTDLIYKALQRMMRKVVPAGTTTGNITPDIALQRYRDHQAILRDALVAMLTDGALLGADVGRQQTDWVLGVGKAATIVGVDWDLINADVLAWVTGGGAMGGGFGEGYANAVLAAMSTTSERQLNTLISEWIQNGRTYNSLLDDLSRTVFSRQRAEMVATTEITRAYAEGNRAAWRRGGIITQMRWYTSNDERVCPICSGLHSQISDVNGSFNGGYFPPAHPRCRCSVHPYIGDAVTSTAPELAPSQPVAVQPIIDSQDPAQVRRQLAEIERKFASRTNEIDQIRARYESSAAEIGRLTRRQDEVLIEYANATPARKKELNRESKRIREELKSLRALRDSYNPATIRAAYEERAREARKLVYVADPSSHSLTIQSGLGPDNHAVKTANEAMEEFNKLVSKDVMKKQYFKHSALENGSRAYYNPNLKRINMAPGNLVSEAVHELGHSIEYESLEITLRSHEWRDRRTAGEEWQRLSDITGNRGYRSDELAKPDRFIEPYIGKSYTHTATEVVSMGIQYMYEDAVLFARRDPDMFDFIYDLLRGRDTSKYGVYYDAD